MAIGLPSPRPAIRLVEVANHQIALRYSNGQPGDFTADMRQFSKNYINNIDQLSDYIVCAKSPTCGLERVRIYDEKSTNNEKKGIGIFTAELIKQRLWLPIEEDGRLCDPAIKENFVGRIFALNKLNQLKKTV